MHEKIRDCLLLHKVFFCVSLALNQNTVESVRLFNRAIKISLRLLRNQSDRGSEVALLASLGCTSENIFRDSSKNVESTLIKCDKLLKDSSSPNTKSIRSDCKKCISYQRRCYRLLSISTALISPSRSHSIDFCLLFNQIL